MKVALLNGRGMKTVPKEKGLKNRCYVIKLGFLFCKEHTLNTCIKRLVKDILGSIRPLTKTVNLRLGVV